MFFCLRYPHAVRSGEKLDPGICAPDSIAPSCSTISTRLCDISNLTTSNSPRNLQPPIRHFRRMNGPQSWSSSCSSCAHSPAWSSGIPPAVRARTPNSLPSRSLPHPALKSRKHCMCIVYEVSPGRPRTTRPKDSISKSVACHPPSSRVHATRCCAVPWSSRHVSVRVRKRCRTASSA